MQAISDTYKGRRSFIYDSLSELIERSQQGGNQPVSLSLNEVNSAIKNGNLDSIWKKIQSRREDDPEGAITASRTMLESTLKYILEELGEEYSDKDDLPDLYKRVSQKLNLSPDKHHEQIFKQICQGITSVVIGFGTLRNKYGDAHGKGKLYVAPKKRHADLVINLSGTICVFLVETFKEHSK